MTDGSRRVLRQAPRVLGIAVALFLGIFALDAFEGGRGFVESLPGFVVHLAPSLLLLAVVAVAWHREWLGGIVFVGLAAFYAATTFEHPDWIVLIAGPVFVVGVLYFASWRMGGGRQ
jgi:hypothetical protein